MAANSLIPVQAPISASKTDAAVQEVRNLADFPLSKWTTYFTNCLINDADLGSQWRKINELKAELRTKLRLLTDKPLSQLTMIDAIQQLGLGYQFQEEIDQATKKIFEADADVGNYDLYHTSLYFRLLRQNGHNISSSVFKKFIDTSGNGGLKQDNVLGMVAFYEAAQLRVNADAAILDEDLLARCFTHLESMAEELSQPLKTQVIHALKQSIHKDIPWLRARKFLDNYQEDESHDATILSLAKLHFNVLQKHHQQELSEISKHWNGLDIPNKFPYARDRLVEAYIWGLGIYYEPQYRVGRKMFTKLIALLTVIDDTYDAYGTADELEILTEAMTRGDTSLLLQLPAYARDLCQALLDFYAEIEQDMAIEGRSFAAAYPIKWMKMAGKFYYDEFLWLKNRHVPSMEEYRQIALATSNMTGGIAVSLAGLGNDVITKAAFDWVSNQPEMVVSCLLVGRFQNDMVSHEFEQGREHVPSAVECCMKEYGVGKEEADKELRKEITNAWKVINEGCLKPTALPFPVLQPILNFARIMDVFYKDEDVFTHPARFLDDKITSLLVRPVE